MPNIILYEVTMKEEDVTKGYLNSDALVLHDLQEQHPNDTMLFDENLKLGERRILSVLENGKILASVQVWVEEPVYQYEQTVTFAFENHMLEEIANRNNVSLWEYMSQYAPEEGDGLYFWRSGDVCMWICDNDMTNKTHEEFVEQVTAKLAREIGYTIELEAHRGWIGLQFTFHWQSPDQYFSLFREDAKVLP